MDGNIPAIQRGCTLYELSTDAFFDSAHFLSDYYGKCENLHGHRWKVTVTIAAEELQGSGDEAGMVCDFGAFKQMVRSTVEELDHTFLVQEGTLGDATLAALASEGFELKLLPFRTTAENIAKHLFDRFKEMGSPVISVEVDETPNNRATYREDIR